MTEAEKPISLDILKTNGKAVQTWLERRRHSQTQIVHIIVDEMHYIKIKILLNAFKSIAYKLSDIQCLKTLILTTKLSKMDALL